MVLIKTLTAVCLSGLASAAILPRSFTVPSTNGFPNPNPQQQKNIAKQAGGLPPNGALPTMIGEGTATAFQLIAFNELFESAYFGSLVANITNDVPGYTSKNKTKLLDVFNTVLAQEEIHSLGAIGILKTAGRFAPSPCQYMFPTTNLQDAILLAETFTAVVLGALQDANTVFAMDQAPMFVRLISSVIGQEGEQNGYYRGLLNRVPSESPFLTAVPAAFAWSALQLFVVPNSCPFPLANINLPIFPALATNGGPITVIEPKDQTLSFSSDLSSMPAAMPYVGGNGKGLFITYQTGQLLPISVPITNVKWSGKKISFQANFPYTENVMHGFSHGALTIGNNFCNLTEVVSKTLAAPAVIQVNNPI